METCTHTHTHLPDVVKVSVRRRLLREELLIRVEHRIEVELLLEQHQTVVGKALDGPERAVPQHAVHLGEELSGRTRDLRLSKGGG